MSSAVVCHRTCSPSKVKTTVTGVVSKKMLEEIRRRHDWRCRLETVTEPHQTDRRQCDQGEHDCERPNVWKSHSRGADGLIGCPHHIRR